MNWKRGLFRVWVVLSFPVFTACSIGLWANLSCSDEFQTLVNKAHEDMKSRAADYESAPLSPLSGLGKSDYEERYNMARTRFETAVAARDECASRADRYQLGMLVPPALAAFFALSFWAVAGFTRPKD